MKKFILLLSLIIIPVFFFAGVIDTEGPHTFFNGDTLKKDSTKVASNLLYCSQLRNLHIWVKTTNPVDSTKYRIYYKVKFALTDTLATPSDSAGAESGNTIIRVEDTLWHYRSIKVAPQYIQLFMKALTGHGNRARVWLKVYISDN